MKYFLLSFVVASTVCSSAVAQNRRDPIVAQLAGSEQRFAEKIYRSVAEQKRSGNLLIAPYGVFESLTMLQIGARGETQDELKRATGVRLDQSTMAAFGRVRQSAFPLGLRFGASVSDNDGYGVKVLEQPSAEIATLGLEKGDLIFTVDGRPVRSARDFTDACSQSTGTVRLDGYSASRGQVFTSTTVPLKRVRELEVAPAAHVINFASALWLREDFLGDSTYPDRLNQMFGTTTFGSTFRSADEIGQQANQFFREQTGGRIARVRMPESLRSDTVMVLMNAMAMDAKWQRRFQAALTKSGNFASPDGVRQVEYMQQQSVFAYAKSNGLQVAEFPYRNTDLRMTLFIPQQPADWSAIESKVFLSGLELHNISRKMRPTRLDVKMPKFEIRMSGSLKSMMEKVVSRNMFTRDADFRGIDSKNRVMLNDMRQQVYITTNEEGTRAGSVTTAVGILKSAAVRAEPFHAVHPFLFLIRDSNGVVYFAGRVTHPKSKTL